MKKTSLLTMAVAPMLLGAPMALNADSVTTDPVGFVKLELEPGLQTLGMPMVKAAVAAGLVESSDGSSVTMASEIAAELSGGSYYLEVVSGEDSPWVGDRFEITGVDGSTVSIDSSASSNTVDLGSIDLADHSVVIRPHVTLREAFPAEEMNEGDQILVFNRDTGGFDVTTLEADFFTGELDWAQDVVLRPGMGFFYRNTSEETASITNLGEVRTNNFRQPLGQGLNLVAEGHPLDASPSSRLMNEENGFQAGDQVLVFNRGTGGFNVATYEEDFFSGDLAWNDDSDLFSAAGSVFIRKGTADPDYEAPRNF